MSALRLLTCIFLLWFTQVAVGDAPVGTTSRIQMVYQPADIYASGSEPEIKTTFAVRALSDGLKDLKVMAGTLRDDDSSEQLTTDAFELVPIEKGAANGDIKTTDLSRFALVLKPGFRKAGRYSGTLWIGATGDTGAQSVPLKVFIRPDTSWFIGFLAITVGAGISWFALFWVARQRQLAANQVLVARLNTVITSLVEDLQTMTKSGVPEPVHTLEHLNQIIRTRLPQLMHDKELSVIAGVVVPASDSVSVIDEVDGMNRIVRHGFDELARQWNLAGANQNALRPLFQKMDALGTTAQPLNTIDTKIQAILANSPNLVAREQGGLPPLPSENSIVHRVVTTTFLLDFLSVATVVVVGIFVLIWRNPGFGTIGDYLQAFLWGLGLKIGSDLTRLGPGDIRTSFGIKTPAP